MSGGRPDSNEGGMTCTACGFANPDGMHDHLRDYRVYEALDLEGHRWRFLQWMREVPQ